MSLFTAYVAYQFVIIALLGWLGLLVGPVGLVLFEKSKKARREFTERLERELELPVLNQYLLVVRSKWDEALATLVGSRLLTWTSAKLWSFFMLPVTWGGKLNTHLWVGIWNVPGILITCLGFYLLQPITIFCGDGIYLFFGEAPPVVIWDDAGAPVVSIEPKGPTFIACQFSPPRIHQYGFRGAVLALPFTLFVGYAELWITFVPVLGIIIITGISFLGFKTTISHIFLDISAKSTPPGRFDEFMCSGTLPRKTWFRHSLSYQDPVCISYICDWLQQKSIMESSNTEPAVHCIDRERNHV